MVYICKRCGAEYDLREIDLEAAVFCECGSQEITFLRTAQNYKPKKKDTLAMIMEGVRDHYKAA